MSESGEYSLVTDAGIKLSKSRGYTGRGTATYSNGDKFEGYFVEGMRHGKQGKYLYANGDKFEGEYIDNKRQGLGKFEYYKGGSYFGYFNQSKRSSVQQQ